MTAAAFATTTVTATLTAADTSAPRTGVVARLSRPTTMDARVALDRIYGEWAERVWAGLLAMAGGDQRAHAFTIDEVVATMLLSNDGVVRLCGRALEIRLRTYDAVMAASR